jgi:phasin family protein
MSAIPQQVLDSQKAALDAILAVQGTVFTGFEKLVDLNLKVMKATLDEVSQKSSQAIAVKDPQEAIAMTTALAAPTAEKAMAYSKHVYDIVSGVQADLSKLSESHIAEGQKHIHEAVEHLSKNAPTGSESAVAMLKSSLAQASSAYDAVTKAAKQATAAAEKNLSAAASASFKAATEAAEVAKTATSRARRTAA